MILALILYYYNAHPLACSVIQQVNKEKINTNAVAFGYVGKIGRLVWSGLLCGHYSQLVLYTMSPETHSDKYLVHYSM